MSPPAPSTAAGRGAPAAPAIRRGRRTLRWGAAALLLLGAARAGAGTLSRAELVRAFPPPIVVGERDHDLPVWPIFTQLGPPTFATELAGYVFESVDLAPIPGFSGTPLDLLVALDRNGEFLDVRVLSQHEPVFLGGVGTAPLFRFVAQYKGLNLRQNVKIGGAAPSGEREDSANVHLDGITKATASVRIVNQTILSAALRVARARLGFAGRDPDLVAHERTDLFAPMTWEQLRRAGLVQALVVRNREAERAFAGTPAAGLDPVSLARPDDVLVELYAALATAPTAGRNLLDDDGWRTLQGRVNPGDHVLLVMSRGRAGFLTDDFVRGSIPDRITLRQGGLPVELRDLDIEASLRPIGEPEGLEWKAFRVISQSGLDPGAPMDLAIRVTRERGIVYPERTARDFTLALTVPERYLVPAAEDQRGWRSIWRARRGEIAVLLAALALLAWTLGRQTSLVTRTARLRWFRPAFLAFTLLFVGWSAQGQLSIVNLVALLQATVDGRSWAFFLWDPMSTILWVFALGTLVAWGRGAYCGWLCPFGALQELAAGAARLARLPRLRLSDGADRRLKAVKYAVLALVLGAAVVSRPWADRAVEVEPFKTAITMVFARSWPFVAYAAALVAAGAVVDKLFCRYLCPLGAALALGGKLRRLDWLRRRGECGRPCQTCRHRCDYQAIGVDGRIDYAECLQCMECVAVFHDDARCAPRILEAKGRRMKLVQPGAGARRAREER